jgi:hypothetical protein
MHELDVALSGLAIDLMVWTLTRPTEISVCAVSEFGRDPAIP